MKICHFFHLLEILIPLIMYCTMILFTFYFRFTMSATAGPVHEMQAPPPPLVSNSESTEPVAGSADGTPTSATAPTMGPSVQGTTASSSLPESIESTVAVSVTPAQSSLSQTGSLVKQNEPVQDSVRAKFASSSGYVVPAPSFSYNVVPRMNSTPSNTQQPSSSPVSFSVVSLSNRYL